MTLFLYVVLYAFFGWILEVIFYVYKTKSFVNRGFLNGPFVPIYGVSLVTLHIIIYAILGSLTPLTIETTLIVFLFIVIISTLFELIGGMVLYNTFHIRWWDYSEEKFNYKGYISLRFSIIWGFLGTLAFLGLHVQVIEPLITSIPETTLYVLTSSLAVVIIIDYVYTLKAMFSFRALITELKGRLESLEKHALTLKSHLPKSVLKTFETIHDSETFRSFSQRYESVKSKLIEIKDKRFTTDYNSLSKINKDISKSRLFKAFPELKLPFIKQRDDRDA